MTTFIGDFASLVSSAQAGEVLIPSARRMLFDPEFEGFDVHARRWTKRDYDGKFHPSSHSMLTLRQLYLYLTCPQLLEEERFDMTSVLAVTAGSFWHEFFQNLWIADGLMIKQREKVPDGLNPGEVVVDDPSTNRTGHADGELHSGELVEIKTVNEFQILKITNELILREKKPGYYCQTQDYLDVLGRDVMRYFTINPTYPFPMIEFTVKADKKYQAQRRGEYQRAMELSDLYPEGNAVEIDGLIPECCGPGSKAAKNCFARLACPVGRFS